MLNYLWGFMILLGLSVGIISGQVEAVSNAAIDSAGEAVTLAITMLGIMSLWTGLIEIARQAGLLDILTRKLRPVLRFLFPRIPAEHVVNEYLTANILANILGLGWAATPMGLKAMKELAVLERERLAAAERERLTEGKGKKRDGRGLGSEKRNIEGKEPAVAASDEMCTFLVLNISSLQVIPVNIIAYRAQYGAVNPAAVVLPGLIATTISTLVAVIFCRLCMKKR